MVPVAEFELSNPILQETREALPELRIRVEDEHVSPKGIPELVFLAIGSDDSLEALDGKLSADPSVADYEVLGSFPNGKLVQITLSEEGFKGMTYPIAVNYGITFLNVEAQGTGIRYRAQVPTLDELSAYREHCSERDLSFKLINLHQSQSVDDLGYGLTARQREVLLHALETGYFEVPRQTTLEDLAAEFDVSDQALSALLRRGHTRLLRHTIATEMQTSR